MQFFFDPRSVLLIGVSRQSGVGAYNNLEMMLRYGYRGRIDLVHPEVTEILGRKTYKRVSELPETPDLAVISVGRDRVLPAFSECVEKGISRAIIISQGFADADHRGKELQKQLIAMAQKHGIRVVGPNTMGVLNAFSGFSTAFIDLRRDPSPPAISMIVQSGVFQVGVESFSGSLGKAIDIGNASDVDFVDALEFFENDPQTRIIVLHMEGMSRGREFLNVAERISRTKPIIVLKTGRSKVGARAALSHTGSLVGEDALFDLAFSRAGLIRVRNMIELRAACNAFLHFRLMSGPKIGVATATGACGIMTADACEDYGLELAPFPELLRQLENSRIPWHHLHNPVDLWPLGMVSGSFTDVFKRSVIGLLDDDNVDAVLGIAPALLSPLHQDVDMSAAAQEVNLANLKHKPIALWLYGGAEAQKADALKHEVDVACFSSIDEAVMGLSAVWRYQNSLFQRKQAGEEDTLVIPPRPAPSPSTLLESEGLMVGEQAFALLRQYDIPVVSGETAHDLNSAKVIAARLGYPVALKIISPQWLHKSDWGGVRLDIGTETELMQSFKDINDLFLDKTPEGTLKGILVQKQVPGRELLLGIKRDPQFGPVILVGSGGIYAEIFKDVARELAPVSRSKAKAMLESLRTYPILQGIRGQKGINLDAIAETLLRLSQLALDHSNISEVDLNPIMADAHGCVCVDCRIILTSDR